MTHPQRVVFLAPATLAEDIRRLDLRIKDAARVLAVSERTLYAYKAGTRRIPRPTAQQWQRYLSQQGS
jgi:predicted transcriptional regulator